MRAVWMPSMSTVFDPDVRGMKQLLPDVTHVDIKFRGLTPHTRFEPHLADKCTFRFANGKSLEVEGVYLWKFLDAIPRELGTDEHGYVDQNPYANDYAEAMMVRLRGAYRLAFGESKKPGELRRPVSARIDLAAERVDEAWRRKLEGTTAKFLSDALIRLAEEDTSVGQKVGRLVAEETGKPKFELGFVDIGGGMLGRKPQESPWPDLSTMRYEEFSRLLSSRTRNGGPVHYSQSDLVSEIFEAASQDLLAAGLAKLRKENPGWFADFAQQLGCKSKAPRTATALEALAESDDRFVGSDAIFEVWHQRLKSKTVKQVIALGAEKIKAEPKAKVKVPKRFRMVMALWISPDFSEVEAGRKPAPYVNHDVVDFEALRKLLAEAFRYGPDVEIRIANDTIDQVTIHMRGPSKMECKDFGEDLLTKASQTTGEVVEIRREWSKMHVMRDRAKSPPPIAVPFVVEAHDFEDAMLWQDQTSPVIGMPLMMERMEQEWRGEATGKPEGGKLPQDMKKALEAIFGCAFQRFAILSRLASDPIPK